MLPQLAAALLAEVARPATTHLDPHWLLGGCRSEAGLSEEALLAVRGSSGLTECGRSALTTPGA